MSLLTHIQRPYRYSKRVVRALKHEDLLISPQVRRSKLTLGSPRAQWSICPDHLTCESIVYSVGVGTDISFDLELIERFKLRVHAFDPTPRSIEWIQRQALPNNFEFHDYGVADLDGTMAFNPPADSAFVSYSSVRQHSTGIVVEAPVRKLASIMQSLKHDHIDVLKMDIEGGEYGVISDLLASKIQVKQLLVEFHHHWPEIGIEKTKNAIAELNATGLKIFEVSPSGEEYSFIRS